MSLDKEAARGEYAREQSVFPDIPPWAAGLVGIIIGVMTLPVWIALMAKLPEGEDLARLIPDRVNPESAKELRDRIAPGMAQDNVSAVLVELCAR